MKQLGGMDASFLYLETAETPMHIGGLSLFELPEGYDGNFYEDFKAHFARRMHLVSVFNIRVEMLPYGIDHPVGVAEDNIDLDYHIRHTTLPKPGSLEQLEALIGQLHSKLLDRSRPLWEYYVIDGLANGQIAIYSKGHHALLDGSAGMAITKALFDTTPEPREIAPPPEKPRGASSQSQTSRVLSTIYGNFLRQQLRNIVAIPAVLKAVGNVVAPRINPLKWEVSALRSLKAPKTSLNVAISGERAWAMKSLPLDAVKRIAKKTETTLNDVVMAICSGAVRRYLHEKHDLPRQSLTAFVPVSLREQGNTDMNNQVFAMICSLATNVADPFERLLAIRDSSGKAKQFTGQIKNAVPRDFSFVGAPLLLQGVMGLYGRFADKLPAIANVGISNVPGPQTQLYLAGAKMLSIYPVSIPSHGAALTIVVQSYCGALDFGLIACRRTVPDIRKLADYVGVAWHELQAAVAANTTAEAVEPAPEPRKPAPAVRSKKTATTQKKKTAIKQTSRAATQTKKATATQMKIGTAAHTKKAGSTAKVMTVRARSRSRNEVSN